MLIIAVVDGMGGGLGSQLITQLKQAYAKKIEIIALGTNSTATTAMIKAGANKGATGENAIRVNLQRVNVVIGPIGIIMPDALMGEITQHIANLIITAPCRKVLLPMSQQQHVELIGIENKPLNVLIKDASDHIGTIIAETK